MQQQPAAAHATRVAVVKRQSAKKHCGYVAKRVRTPPAALALLVALSGTKRIHTKQHEPRTSSSLCIIAEAVRKNVRGVLWPMREGTPAAIMPPRMDIFKLINNPPPAVG
jgi:hypothetical protein